MILWRQTIGISLGLVAASGLWAGAQAYPSPEDSDAVLGLVQVDQAISAGPNAEYGPIETAAPSEDLAVDVIGEPLADLTPVLESGPVEPTMLAIAPVTPEILEQLSQEQLAAIAAIISSAEASANNNLVAELPPEVLSHIDVLPIIERQVGRRRWMPTGLVRRLRVPQLVTALIRQPRNTALVMLGNHIVVVNPVTGAILGAVLSAL